MKTIVLNKKKKDINLSEGTIFIQVNETEALLLINSLTNQILHKNSNFNRVESYDKTGNYFSIAVSN